MLSVFFAKYRLALLGVAFAAAFVGGWTVQGWRLNAKHSAEILVAARKAKEAYEAKEKQYNEASAALEVARNEREIVYRTIEKQVEKIVDRPVYLNVCLDDDGLRIVNDALAGRAADPPKPASGMPAADTP
jgi:hypothetical protein